MDRYVVTGVFYALGELEGVIGNMMLSGSAVIITKDERQAIADFIAIGAVPCIEDPSRMFNTRASVTFHVALDSE